MKLYTKTGDCGQTTLIGGERVSKCDVRVEAYGTVDELSANVALLGDMLRDEESTEEEMGKSVHTDASHNKTTFMTYFDPTGAREYAAALTAEAITAVSDMDGSERLTDLAVYLLHRTY
jgi:cob(I)alamin adenosyltransferase